MESDGESSNSVAGGTFRRREPDPYQLKSGDNLSLVLVAEPLNEFNYATWSKAMIRGIISKRKLKFITGEIVAPDEDDPRYDEWDEVNSTVISWILNAITAKIARGFMFFEDAYSFWKEIKERFGESNGPQLHKLRKDICDLKQGSQSVSVYYTKLCSLWDEYACLRPRKKCTAGCINYDCLTEEEDADKLSQFLGLNDEYGAISHQILLMEPPPTVSKTCSMVARVERQMNVHGGLQDVQGNSAMAARVYRDGKVPGPSVQQKQYWSEQNQNPNGARDGMTILMCSHCGRPGHVKEFCYKIIGFPDGWVSKKERYADGQQKYQRNQSSSNYQRPHQSNYGKQSYGRPQQFGNSGQKYVAHAVAEDEDSSASDMENQLHALVAKLVDAQLEKKMKGKEPMIEQGGTTNYAHYHDFAGPQD